MASEEELFANIDALLEEEPQLPPPAERARLREAAGITQVRLAQALKSTVQTVKNYENGRSEPKSPRLEAYQRLLKGGRKSTRARHPAAPARPRSSRSSRRCPRRSPARPPRPDRRAGSGSGRPGRARATRPSGRAPGDVVPAPGGEEGRRARRRPALPHGPLAVLDGDGSAYGVNGLVLDCPASTVVELVEWTLRESGLGAPKLHRNGKDSDPLIVLTAARREARAAGAPGGPARPAPARGPPGRQADPQGEVAAHAARVRPVGADLPQGHREPAPVRAARGPALGRPQLRDWPGVSDMEPADIARVLGIYAQRVITPRGNPAVNGLELMTALRPPTRPVRDEETGNWVSGHNPGSLGTQPMDPAPPEGQPEHPAVFHSGWKGGFLREEAYQWVRPVELLTDEECHLPYAVGLDLNTAFLAAAARLTVGLSEPVHFVGPQFNPKIPGSWLVDLSHVELDPRLPSPFTPTGERPTGPAWYQTHTVAYAQELGYNVQPIEAYLRKETGAYLDPWHDRLKTAYVDTLADMGVTKDLSDTEFLEAMARHKDVDPALTAVLAAIKATVKGGIGKLFENPQGKNHKDGDPWPAMMRPTWRPDIRAAVISKARVNMHRKLFKMAEMTGLYPLAVLSDCVVYPSPGRAR